MFTDRQEAPVPPGSSYRDPSELVVLGDCPECMVPASVLEGLCEVCFAELDEVAPSRLPTAS